MNFQRCLLKTDKNLFLIESKEEVKKKKAPKLKKDTKLKLIANYLPD